LAASAYDNDTTYTYCTECILERGTDPAAPDTLRGYLQTVGDCVVVVDDDDIIKVHVHTDNPGSVLQRALSIGQLLTVKVDNMKEQTKSHAAAPSIAEPVEVYGFVAVAAGDGVQALFHDLGVSHVVNGGQSMNPSTEELLTAILQTPAKTVYLLPNNKNILMAAKQAASLAEDRAVVIVPTKTVPQGISALIAFSSTRTAEENRTVMTDAAHHVATGQITYAARDAKFGTTKIKTGDLLGLIDGKLTLVEKDHDVVHGATRLIRSMLHKHTRFVTILYGSDVTEAQAEAVYNKIKAKADKDVELTMVPGGQPVYAFVVSVE
jgi:DAK2 domain fusion protein YloV